MGTKLPCRKKEHILECVCLSLAKLEKSTQSEKVAFDLGLWGDKDIYMWWLERKRSFGERGGRDEMHKSEQTEIYSLHLRSSGFDGQDVYFVVENKCLKR